MTDYSTSMRTSRCGDLRADDIGATVTLCGWVDRVREHGEHLAFVDLRDRSGMVQVVVDGGHELRSEFVLQVTGEVRARPEDTANESLATGMVEVEASEVAILSRSEPSPFPMDERTDVDEVLRLRHRYVDLRRSRMQRNLEVRATVNSAIRGAMEEQGFIEVETPMLVASTPEGARDFVVPSRKVPGSFYALPQSPQLFKQLCMVGGVDRYYQIARCLRDEDLRADRQYEFMQLDAEASFVGQEDVLAFISHAVSAAAEAVTGERPADIPRMTWLEAQERYGSDKPDTRFGLELVELTEVFAGTEFRAFQAPCVKGIRVPGGSDTSRNRLDDLTEQCKRWGAKGLVWMKVEADGLNSPVAKFLSDDEQAALRAALAAEAGDLLFLVGRRLPPLRGAGRGRQPDPGPPPVHDAPRGGPGTARVGRPAGGSLAGLRPGPERLGTRLGQRADPPCGGAADHLHAPRHRPGGGTGQVRIPARRLPVRGAAPRRLCLRHGPAHRRPGRRGEHPRGHRLPQDPVGRRPADRGTDGGRRPAPRGARPTGAAAEAVTPARGFGGWRSAGPGRAVPDR